MAVFILRKSVKQVLRRFMYLSEDALQRLDSMVGDYFDAT